MQTATVTVIKDSTGYKDTGYPWAVPLSVQVLGIENVPVMSPDLYACNEAIETRPLMKLRDPVKGIIWVDETVESLDAKLHGTCCTADKTGFINEDLTTSSPTYQNDDLIGVGQDDFLAFLGGGQIIPTIDPVTGTMDLSANGGFTPGHLSIVYGSGIARPPGTGGSGTWGQITGTLSAQVDLNAALAGKVALNMPNDAISGAVQDIDVTNTNTSGIPSRQLRIGSKQAVIDNLNLQAGSTLSITQKYNTTNENPSWLSMSCPDTGTANGVWVRGLGISGRIYPVVEFRSNYGETNGTDKAVGFHGFVAERASLSECVGFDYAAWNTHGLYTGDETIYNANKLSFHPAGANRYAFTNPNTIIMRYQNRTTTVISVRALGDLHVGGAIYVPIQSFTGNAVALTLDKHTYIYTGIAGDTNLLTLPDPTVADNTGRQHRIVNMGEIDLILSRPVYQDKFTSTTTLHYNAPNNVMNIICDGNRWLQV